MKQRRYVAYLLRLWLSDNAGEPAWRGSLEDPHSGNRLGFANLPSLFEFLREQTEIPSGAPDGQEQQNGGFMPRPGDPTGAQDRQERELTP